MIQDGTFLTYCDNYHNHVSRSRLDLVKKLLDPRIVNTLHILLVSLGKRIPRRMPSYSRSLAGNDSLLLVLRFDRTRGRSH